MSTPTITKTPADTTPARSYLTEQATAIVANLRAHGFPAPLCVATIPDPDGDFLCADDALPGSAYCRHHQHPDLP